jgi:hypothetical protein
MALARLREVAGQVTQTWEGSLLSERHLTYALWPGVAAA